MAEQIKSLPRDLKRLVGNTVALLGNVIEEEGGKSLYNSVEKIRKLMAEYRKASEAQRMDLLEQMFSLINKAPKNSQERIAHSFSLMLELINSCEAAYRTFRLTKRDQSRKSGRTDNSMLYVLTAHPTEARTPENIELFKRIQNVAVRILDKTGEEEYMLSIIKHNLKLAWLLPITRHQEPQVIDEANHLFSIIFRPDIFDTILRADRDMGNIRIRTWVGGDKDGHPGVDEKVMIQCLQASRTNFIKVFERVFYQLISDTQLVPGLKLKTEIKNVEVNLKAVKKIAKGDSKKVRDLHASLLKMGVKYHGHIGEQSPRIRKLESIFKLFPALVIPIELREDSEIVLSALNSEKRIAIHRMLIKLSEIASKGETRHYAKSFILSMCHSYEDIVGAKKLVKKVFGELELPIVPLFETSKALDDSEEVVNSLLKDKEFLMNLKNKWDNQLEIMLGYSDSSKGMGVLPSRVGIAKTIRNLDTVISSQGIIPVFFHGSGGSVDRGGGSLEEQTKWWPRSALFNYKATIQGEMVERNFSSPEVTMSGMNKILDNFNRSKTKSGNIKLDKCVELFANKVKDHYVQKINDSDFFEMIESATPYTYLSALKLGSRPTKRAKARKLDLSSIRAIPWILCWTQIRILFPTWWGVGSTWKEIKNDEKLVASLKKSFKTSALFSSYMRVLGFTLSKVETPIFKMYLKHSSLDKEAQEKIFNEFLAEYKATVSFLREMSGSKSLLWYRPWLSDSIRLRSSMIHPLNALQIIAFQKKDFQLLRKTVAGISSGMMTTG